MNLEKKNQFEKVCIIASKNNWCWKLFCTTCGCRDIRGAFYSIGINQNIPTNLRRISQINNSYRVNTEFSDTELNIFLQSVITSNLFNISKNCKFPDWLGYIGLVLHLYGGWNRYYEIARTMGKTPLIDVAKALCPQLIQMVHKDSNAFIILNNIIESDYMIELKVSDLEQIELGMIL